MTTKNVIAMEVSEVSLSLVLTKSRLNFLFACPNFPSILSNLKLGVFNTLEEHNLKVLLDRGLCITINSDDPAYFGGYVNENLMGISQALDLTENDLKKMINNSFKASFLEQQEKEKFYIQ